MSKAALITGGAKRIGREISIYLAKSGYNIALHFNKSEKEAESLKDQIKKYNVECGLFQADLNYEDNYNCLLENVKTIFPNLSLLINNASIFIRALITDTDNELLDKTLSINFNIF